MKRLLSFLKTPLALGVAVLLLVAATVQLSQDDDAARDHIVVAHFDDASPLVKGGTVKADGVIIGEITDIRLDGGAAAVSMRLDADALPLRNDATATIRAKSLLGERYVDIDPGSAKAGEMEAPGTITADRASSAEDLQDVLNSLDAPTSSSLAALLTTLGEGGRGQGESVRRALRRLAPTSAELADLGVILKDQNQTLAAVIDQLTPVLTALGDADGKSLDRVVAAAEVALSSVAGRRRALDLTLRRLPAALRTFRTTVTSLTGVSDDASATLRGLRPVTSKLPAIATELRSFANAADPALASLPEVLRTAETLIEKATPVVERLGPGTRSLRGVSSDSRKLLAEIQPDLQVVLDFVRGWALSTNGMDGLGNYFRGVVAYTPKDLLQAPGIPIPGADPYVPGKTDDAAGAPEAPAGTPGLDDVLGGLGVDVNGLLGGKQAKSGDSATGLTQSQEGQLLELLLGGGR